MKTSDRGRTPENQGGVNRREFVRLGAGVAAYAWAGQMLPFETRAQAAVNPLNTADAVIFIKLAGAPSHMDTFSIKVGSWTPANFNVQTRGGITLPARLFPKMLQQTNKFSILHSVQSWVPVHQIGQYWIDTSQDFNAALAAERPALGAVVAKEYQEQRGPDDVLPGFVSLVASPQVGNGFFNGLVAPFPVPGGAPQGAGRLIGAAGLGGLTHPRGQAAFDRYYNHLQEVDAENRGGNPPWGKALADYNDFFSSAKGLMYNPNVAPIFQYTDEERVPYGTTVFGDAMIVARNLVAANKGTKFVHVTYTGWDMHNAIYSTAAGAASLYNRCPQLDAGVAQLLLDMSNMPSPTREGRSLLDTTLVVMMGEFGRTPPSRYGATGLSARQGRDHYANVQFAVMAGGGVRGGRNIGVLNADGSAINNPQFAGGGDRGYPAGPNIRMEDIGVTIYSAMNINWTKEIYETPSRRVYQYINGGPNTFYKEIRELFF